MTRQRLLDIFLTALMGATIAFLQSFLVGLTSTGIPVADPSIAAGAAAVAKGALFLKNPIA